MSKRKVYRRLSMYKGSVITTYTNVTVGMVKRFLRTNGIKLSRKDLLGLKIKSKLSLKLYRGYVNITKINYNWKTKKLYVVHRR